MTVQLFNEIPAGTVFAYGITTNDTKGAYMSGSRIGDKLRWAAVKGHGNDWCIYCLWANESTHEMVVSNGDKITTREYIQNLVSCDDELLKLYRR